MRYANEALVLWFVVCCTYIVWTNPNAHVAFIGISAAVFGLYKWAQEREVTKRVNHQQVSGE